jgi:uncharacterized protein (DUF433 family)
MGHVYRSDAAESNPAAPHLGSFWTFSTEPAEERAPLSPPTGQDFQAFCESLRDELAPDSTLEDVMVDRVVLAAWRLSRISSRERASAENGEALPLISRETLRAESSLETAINLLESARRAPSKRWGKAEYPVTKIPAELRDYAEPDMHTEASDYLPDDRDDAIPSYFDDLDLAGEANYSNEWPCLPDRDDETDAPPSGWATRLTIDANVSDSSPVVSGTWVTVDHVVTLIVDGWSWSDILRTHPELTEDDVRACLAYTVEKDGREGF